MQPIDLDPDSYRAHGWWRDRLVTDDLRDRAARTPDDIAAVTYSADGEWVERLTYRELNDAVDAIAAGLLALGVQHGDVVAHQIPNWWYFTAVHLACVRIGSLSCPIIPILRRRELEYVLRATKAEVFIVPRTYRSFDHAGLADGLRRTVPRLRHVFAIDGPRDGAGSFQKYFLQPSRAAATTADLDGRTPAADDPASIQFTSGTTGEPKGVVHTHNTLFATTRLLPYALRLTGDDVVIMPSPLAHASGFLYGVLMPITWGQKVVYQDVWNADTFLDITSAEGGTYTIGSPPFVMDTIKACQRRGVDAAPLRIFSCAGAPIPRFLADEAPRVLHARLANNWGLTETGAATITPADELDRAADSDGAVSPAMRVRIVDHAGDDQPVGTTGRLLVKGASQFLGYFNRSDLTAAVVDDEGWLDTGDVARVDETGFVALTGRVKDIVIRGGENIPVVEVENALFQYPGITDAAVIGLPDDRLGERACAVVVTQDRSLSLSDLTEYLDGRGFAKQFWPERLELVETIPHNAAGKIQKYLLRERFVGNG
jgi:cyclohexanecarboxylate-CoA ligase